eukprot:CAMPEP_0114145130 /NCGR_PEP_ID=MMETSP0043_2-20121206/19888_1 /TAXON_ID=464988 /ORGANISM="Hemiselmis andersenii, Strain CCMP644" /LENGTH=336 /DNA_ID=CAMNT_0001239539 /DNA_START=114 /DNA_END=1120 /DNA_ORIENTATION=+
MVSRGSDRGEKSLGRRLLGGLKNLTARGEKSPKKDSTSRCSPGSRKKGTNVNSGGGAAGGGEIQTWSREVVEDSRGNVGQGGGIEGAAAPSSPQQATFAMDTIMAMSKPSGGSRNDCRDTNAAAAAAAASQPDLHTSIPSSLLEAAGGSAVLAGASTRSPRGGIDSAADDTPARLQQQQSILEQCVALNLKTKAHRTPSDTNSNSNSSHGKGIARITASVPFDASSAAPSGGPQDASRQRAPATTNRPPPQSALLGASQPPPQPKRKLGSNIANILEKMQKNTGDSDSPPERASPRADGNSPHAPNDHAPDCSEASSAAPTAVGERVFRSCFSSRS